MAKRKTYLTPEQMLEIIKEKYKAESWNHCFSFVLPTVRGDGAQGVSFHPCRELAMRELLKGMYAGEWHVPGDTAYLFFIENPEFSVTTDQRRINQMQKLAKRMRSVFAIEGEIDVVCSVSEEFIDTTKHRKLCRVWTLNFPKAWFASTIIISLLLTGIKALFGGRKRFRGALPGEILDVIYKNRKKYLPLSKWKGFYGNARHPHEMQYRGCVRFLIYIQAEEDPNVEMRV